MEAESSIEHIKSLERVFINHGVDTQWLQVLKDYRVEKRNALSPQAKGKYEKRGNKFKRGKTAENVENTDLWKIDEDFDTNFKERS